MCRDGVRGECWLLWSVRDGGAEGGAENDLEIAKKHGKQKGLSSAEYHLGALLEPKNFSGCPHKKEAIEAVKEHKRQILLMPD